MGLTLPVGKTGYRTQLVLVARFVLDERAGLRETNMFNAQFGPSRAILASDGHVRLELALPLMTGLTEDYLRLAFDTFIDNMEQLDFIVSGGGEDLNRLPPN